MMRTVKIFLVAVATLLFTGATAFLTFYYWASATTLSVDRFDTGELIVRGDVAARSKDNDYTIVTYNVGYASGLTNNTAQLASAEDNEANLQLIIGALKLADPDFIAFQEIDYDSARSYHQDQLLRIADALGLQSRARAYNWDVRYLPFPYWPPTAHFGKVVSGQAIAGGFPIESHSKVTLLKPAERPFYYNQFYLDRIAQVTKVEIGDKVLTLINVHLEAYMSGTRQKQSLQLAQIVDKHNKGPLILLGDFNALPPWSTAAKKIAAEQEATGKFPDNTIKNILELTGLHAAISQESYADGNENQYFSFRSDDPSVHIDHIMYNDYVQLLSARVMQDAGTGSDHLPVVMRFSLR